MRITLLLALCVLARDCPPWLGGGVGVPPPEEPALPDCHVSTCAVGDHGGCGCWPGTHYECDFNMLDMKSYATCVTDPPASACRDSDVWCVRDLDCCSAACDVHDGTSSGFCQ